MEQATTIGLDIAKHVFQLHGADAAGHVLFRKRITRVKLLGFLGKRRTMRALGTVWQRRYNLDSGAAENGRRGQKTGFVLGLSCAVFGVKTESGRDQTQPCASRVFLAITKLASANRVRSCAVFLARPR